MDNITNNHRPLTAQNSADYRETNVVESEGRLFRIIPEHLDQPYTQYEENKRFNGRIIRALDTLQQRPPTDWIVDNILPVNSLTLLVGEPGSKKTYAMLSLAVCVATGKQWLGMNTRAGKVLFFDEESGYNRISDRTSNVLRGVDISKDDEEVPLLIYSMGGLQLNTEEGIQFFSEIIEDERPQLIIIDALADIMPGSDENSVKDVQPIFTALRRIAEDYQTAMIIIHHTNKNGGYRGSSAMKAAVDVLLRIDSDQDKPQITITSEKVRDGEPIKLYAHAHFGETTFVLSRSTENMSIHKLSKTDLYVLELITQNGPLALTDISQMVADKGISKDSSKSSVYKLRNLGLIGRDNTGSTGTKAIYRYLGS